jgi:hypothetical protein
MTGPDTNHRFVNICDHYCPARTLIGIEGRTRGLGPNSVAILGSALTGRAANVAKSLGGALTQYAYAFVCPSRNLAPEAWTESDRCHQAAETIAQRLRLCQEVLLTDWERTNLDRVGMDENFQWTEVTSEESRPADWKVDGDGHIEPMD